jgi:phosphopantothenoylcysteine decarboxylase / phosphopantothenate---cysteine ligase
MIYGAGMSVSGRSILLIISGGIAAYKGLELIRLLRKNGATVQCILTSGGQKFITPLSVSALTGQTTYTDLWSLKDETEMGHIRLARDADAILVAPASANIMARIAHGLADDLAGAAILARGETPLILCPAMNPAMWVNDATQANITLLQNRGITIWPPASGDMACGEIGEGRLIEPLLIMENLDSFFAKGKPLAGLKALVTAGPTYEPIDPVRFTGNRSSGKQGYAIAEALGALGADVTLVSGPTSLPSPKHIKTIRCETALEMLEICRSCSPFDIAVFAAAVADWRVNPSPEKIKKDKNDTGLTLTFSPTEDVLKAFSVPSPARPRLVVGFAAETDHVLENAKAKLAAKGCDWLVVNPINSDNPAFGADENQVYFLTSTRMEEWPKARKDVIARKLADEIALHFKALGRGKHSIAAE